MNKYLLSLLFILFQISELLAGPGGRVFRKAFDSPIGKVVMIILLIVLLPLIIKNILAERKGVKNTTAILTKLGAKHPGIFDEIHLKNRVTSIFSRVHKGWSEQDVSGVDEYMTDWYWQNQQMLFLDKWKSEGLRNVCNVKKINSIKPIHIRVTDRPDFEESRIFYTITSEMEDYLIHEETNKIIEGKKGYNNVSTVWTLKLNGGVWKVDNIEQSSSAMDYVKREDVVPQSIMS